MSLHRTLKVFTPQKNLKSQQNNVQVHWQNIGIYHGVYFKNHDRKTFKAQQIHE